jgi:hypothetical protein
LPAWLCVSQGSLFSSLGLRSINEKNATVVKPRHLSRGASKLRHFFSGRDLSGLKLSCIGSLDTISTQTHGWQVFCAAIEAKGALEKNSDLSGLDGGTICLMSEERKRMTTEAERQIAVDIVGRIV